MMPFSALSTSSNAFIKTDSPEVVTWGHIVTLVLVVQPVEAVFGKTLADPPVEVAAPVDKNSQDATL